MIYVEQYYKLRDGVPALFATPVLTPDDFERVVGHKPARGETWPNTKVDATVAYPLARFEGIEDAQEITKKEHDKLVAELNVIAPEAEI